ncbi:MAG TPA: hypothetical protein VGB55_09495 [Tepidisphaeraceae bacterium]|jgi:hypothetical protein
MSDPIVPIPIKRKRRWVSVVKGVLLAIIIYLVGAAMWKQWKVIEAQNIPVQIRPIPLLLALLALIGVSTVQMISYRALLSAYASAPPWRAMLAVAWLPPLGKYVPGKVAALLAAMAILRRFGIPGAVAVAVVLVLDGLAVIAGLITGSPLLLWRPIREIAPWAWTLCVPVVIVGIICLWPSVFGRIINFALKKAKKPSLPKMPPVSRYLIPVTCAFAQWVLAGLGLLLIVASVTGEIKWSHWPLMIAFAALSQTIGYLVLISPGGFGPTQAIQLACLTPLVGPLAAVIVPIRLLAQVFVDLILASVGAFVLRKVDGQRFFNK